MGLSRNCGINFPLLTLYNHLNYDVDIIDNGYNIQVDRAFISRYKVSIEYQTVYLDLDDTLILPNNTINTFLIMFLYQSINKGKKIILLSKIKVTSWKNYENTTFQHHYSRISSRYLQMKKSLITSLSKMQYLLTIHFLKEKKSLTILRSQYLI